MSSRRTLPKPDSSKYGNPGWILRWLSDLVSSWFATRSWKMVPKLIPFLGLLGFVIILPIMMSHRSHYAEVLTSANENKDNATARIALRRLINQYPASETYRYQLASVYFEANEFSRALGLLRALAPVSEQEPGYGPAHLNLVEISDDQTIDFTLSPEQRVFHLRKAWEFDPKNPVTNMLLGQAYLKMQQPRLAEPHLRRISGDSPELLFHFADLEAKLGKQEKAVEAAVRALKLISTRVAQQPNSVEARFLKAKILLALGRGDEGENELTELYRSRPEATRSTLVEFEVMYASKQFISSPMYRDLAASTVSRALQLDPDSIPAANLLVRLAAAGATIPDRMKDRLVEHWEQRCHDHPDDAKTLAACAQMHRLHNDEAAAIDKLQAAAAVDPNLRDSLATMLVEYGRADDATPIISELRGELMPKTASADESQAAGARYRLAKLERLAGNHRQAISLLAGIDQPSIIVRRERVRAVIDDTRQLPPEECLDGLAAAMEILPEDSHLLSRISSLGEEHPKLKPRCRKIILGHVVAGRIPAWRAYAAFGTAANIAKNFDDAIGDLNEAVRLSEKDKQRPDPITLNNLAVATTRGTKPNMDAALTAIDTALTVLPGQVDLLTTRGEVLVVAEQWEAAIDTLTKVVLSKPDNEFVHSLLARAYRGIGNTEMARQHEQKFTIQ